MKSTKGRPDSSAARRGAISQVVERLERRVSHEHGLTIDELMHALEGKGHAAIITVLALPFSQPIQVPGLSMPFGIVLFYSGLRIAFAQQPWLPGWLRVKKIPPATAMALLEALRKVAKLAEKILHPRWTQFCRNPFLHRMHGILIAFLSILLALPLPIPVAQLKIQPDPEKQVELFRRLEFKRFTREAEARLAAQKPRQADLFS